MTCTFPVLPRSLLGLVGLVFVLGGCGGGSTYSLDTGDLAQRYLPTERTVEHHPDSLEALSITRSEGHFQFEFKKDYEALHRKWSCTYQGLGTGRSHPGRSYATFWSLELSLAALQPEVGINTLSEEQAQKSMRKRRKKYNSTIQIDVYWFEEEGNSLLAGPGSQVKLHVNGNRYRPSKQIHGPLREAFIPGRTQGALYRRNTFYFSRVVDSTDILKNAQGVQLHIDQTGTGSRVQFAWSWGGESQASVRSDDRGRIRHGQYGSRYVPEKDLFVPAAREPPVRAAASRIGR